MPFPFHRSARLYFPERLTISRKAIRSARLSVPQDYLFPERLSISRKAICSVRLSVPRGHLFRGDIYPVSVDRSPCLRMYLHSLYVWLSRGKYKDILGGNTRDKALNVQSFVREEHIEICSPKVKPKKFQTQKNKRIYKKNNRKIYQKRTTQRQDTHK